MDLYEFRKIMVSIGFKYNGHRYYEYKNYQIDLYNNYYNFYNGLEWFYANTLTDLRPLEKYFKKELRSIKLKQLLG